VTRRKNKRHGIIDAAREVGNATRRLGDGSRLILRQRVRGSARAVRAVRNTRVFQTVTRVVADELTPRFTQLEVSLLSITLSYLTVRLDNGLIPGLIPDSLRSCIHTQKGIRIQCINNTIQIRIYCEAVFGIM
jgi:hypothetical protein